MSNGGEVAGWTKGGIMVAVLGNGGRFGRSNVLVCAVTHGVVAGCAWFSTSSSEGSSSGSGYCWVVGFLR